MQQTRDRADASLIYDNLCNPRKYGGFPSKITASYILELGTYIGSSQAVLYLPCLLSDFHR